MDYERKGQYSVNNKKRIKGLTVYGAFSKHKSTV